MLLPSHKRVFHYCKFTILLYVSQKDNIYICVLLSYNFVYFWTASQHNDYIEGNLKDGNYMFGCFIYTQYN